VRPGSRTLIDACGGVRSLNRYVDGAHWLRSWPLIDAYGGCRMVLEPKDRAGSRRARQSGAPRKRG
jgi:hypothetical protein